MWFLTGLLWLLLSALPAVAQRLHVVYALEQTDRDYGLLNLQNEELMTQVMRTVAWGTGYPMTTTYLPRTDFTSAGLRRRLAGLKTRPRDVIVLYYSGFGVAPAARSATFANWRLTDVAARGLPVSEVEAWLRAKKVRLSVIFADCSTQRINNDIQLLAVIGAVTDRRKQVIQNLFLKACGLVKLGGSLPAQPAWVLERSKGTVFTAALHKAIETVLLIQDPAQLAAASWATIGEYTQQNMALALYQMPFGQQPVLEQQSCRRVAATPPPLSDPLANETIAGLLNAFIAARDSVQRDQFSRQLLAVCDAQATVTVGRTLNKLDLPLPSPTQLDSLPVRYTLTDYLAQVQKPLPPLSVNGVPVPMARLRAVYVEGKQVDAAGKATALTLYEAWIDQ